MCCNETCFGQIEQGVDSVIPLVNNHVQEIDLTKLKVHRIPVNVSGEDLHEVIPGDFTVEVKATQKAQRAKYSALANLNNQQEANAAFDSFQGNLEKDTSGRLQKLISFQLNKGITGSLYVRKMVHDSPGHVTSNKRSLEAEGTLDDSKKLRTDHSWRKLEEIRYTDHCESHLKEIERLKQELSQRDQEIASLNRIIVALTRKHAL